MKRALITGITGQDGAYLARFLLRKGYDVYGAQRHGSTPSLWRLEALGIADDVRLVPCELLEFSNVLRLIDDVQPDEVYNLAAISYVAPTFGQPIYTAEVNGLGAVRLLEAIRTTGGGARFYQASTSEMYGQVAETPQTERTPFHPRSPYAAAKLYAHAMTVNYREAHGMHCSSGILFNHESPLRGAEFVTRKIAIGLAAHQNKTGGAIRLGNIDARRDWGYAADYVTAMWQMLQRNEPDDYVIATGTSHSVREFFDAAARAIGMSVEWQRDQVAVDADSGRTLAVVDATMLRPADVVTLCGDASKARDALGWSPGVGMSKLAEIMVHAEVERDASA